MVVTRDYFGHERNVRALKMGLPAVSLFVGPRSVGKWELAEWVREKYKIKLSDTLRIQRLTQDNAKFLKKFASGSPQGKLRLVILRLEKATPKALNTVLKTLEESPTTVFILISETMPPPTIRSRAVLFEFGLLTVDEVSSILQVRKNFSEETAYERARVSGGQVQTALEYSASQESKIVVLRALDAISAKDVSLLESLAPRWQEEHTELLVQWCYETATKKWKMFRPSDSKISGAKIPLKILMALRLEPRPRLVVRWALASVLQGEKK